MERLKSFLYSINVIYMNVLAMKVYLFVFFGRTVNFIILAELDVASIEHLVVLAWTSGVLGCADSRMSAALL